VGKIKIKMKLALLQYKAISDIKTDVKELRKRNSMMILVAET
jgi:hypothetical protein